MCASLWELATLFECRIKTKKLHRVLKFNQPQQLKTYVEFNTQKNNKGRKIGDRNGKVLHKSMNNTVYGTTVENLRKRVDVRLASNWKDYLKWTSKLSCISQKIFDDGFVAIRKSIVTLTLNKPVYVWICVLVLSIDIQVPISLQIKTEDLYEDFTKDKCWTLGIIQLSQSIIMVPTN